MGLPFGFAGTVDGVEGEALPEEEYVGVGGLEGVCAAADEVENPSTLANRNKVTVFIQAEYVEPTSPYRMDESSGKDARLSVAKFYSSSSPCSSYLTVYKGIQCRNYTLG